MVHESPIKAKLLMFHQDSRPIVRMGVEQFIVDPFTTFAGAMENARKSVILTKVTSKIWHLMFMTAQ